MDYEVLRDGFVNGVWRTKGETVPGSKSAMRYLELGGQVKEATPKKAPAADAPAAQDAAADVPAAPGGKRK